MFVYEAALNRYAIIPEGFRGCLGRRLALIRPDESKALARFLFYYFFSEDWHRTIAKNTLSGATVDRIPLTTFPTFELNLPDLDIQRKVVAILAAYDDLIENNTRRVAILEETARSLYREWFVNFRFPGHENVEIVDSAMGCLPTGWRQAALREVAKVNEVSIQPKDAPDIVHYIDIASVSPGRVNAIQTMSFMDAPGRARRVVRHGDTIWSNVRPNRRSHALIIDPIPSLIASTGFSVLTPSGVPFSFPLLVGDDG